MRTAKTAVIAGALLLTWSIGPRAGVVASPMAQTSATSPVTAAEHVAAAERYRQTAADAGARARQHRLEAARLERDRLPFERKWPAMGDRRADDARRKAVQADRAAADAAKQADHHMGLATKALAQQR